LLVPKCLPENVSLVIVERRNSCSEKKAVVIVTAQKCYVHCPVQCLALTMGGMQTQFRTSEQKKNYIRLPCLQEVAVTGITEKYVCM
jgi:hypothetical protein